MATARTPRQAWIDAGLRVLAESGPDSVRIESLARDLRVSKGGFYGYFTDRNALLTEMLNTWEKRSVDDVLEQVARDDGDTLAKATRAAHLTFADDLLPIDLAIRGWARRDPEVAERLRRVDNQRMGLLRTSFGPLHANKADLEARCLLAFSAAIAGDLIAVDHPGQTRAEVLDCAARLLFSAPENAGPSVGRAHRRT